MKLDVSTLRYMSKDDFRVLSSIEQGMKNHQWVPTDLIPRIAGLKPGFCKKIIIELLKQKLVAHTGKNCIVVFFTFLDDGYKLTFLGYDFLSIRTFMLRGSLDSIGTQIGVGKESDIFLAYNSQTETPMVLKLHRLGRISFRTTKNNRDYLKHRKWASWLYLSRLAAIKEFAYMKELRSHDFPVPKPIDWNRHCILMQLVDGTPLFRVPELLQPFQVANHCMQLLIRFASYGLIHGDFNEFNLIVNEKTGKVTVIDFPQMVSSYHKNASMYFERDVNSIVTFFQKKYGIQFSHLPQLRSVSICKRLDSDIAASGYLLQPIQQNDFDLTKEDSPSTGLISPTSSSSANSISADISQDVDFSQSLDMISDFYHTSKTFSETTDFVDQDQLNLEPDVDSNQDLLNSSSKASIRSTYKTVKPPSDVTDFNVSSSSTVNDLINSQNPSLHQDSMKFSESVEKAASREGRNMKKLRKLQKLQQKRNHKSQDIQSRVARSLAKSPQKNTVSKRKKPKKQKHKLKKLAYSQVHDLT